VLGDWCEEDDEFVVLLVDEAAPVAKRYRVAHKPQTLVAQLPSSAEAELARNTKCPRLMTSCDVCTPDLAKDFAEGKCWVGIESRVGTLGTTLWCAPRQGWVPFLAEMRARYLAFLVELCMGCWPGWSYHTQMHIIYECEDERPELRWSFCELARLASPVYGAHLGRLKAGDWVFSGDRIVVRARRVYVPAWL
jgi:hypothetical protein